MRAIHLDLAEVTDSVVVRATALQYKPIQRNIGWGIIVDAACVGTVARHLLEGKNLNSIPLGTTLQSSAQDPSNPGRPLASQYLRPDPGYGRSRQPRSTQLLRAIYPTRRATAGSTRVARRAGR
jgi:hypothetical protein